MNDSQNSLIVGCSAFGLDDMTACADGAVVTRTDFSPSVVVLPGRPHGGIRTGNQAKNSREHTGLPWPPEAWVKAGEHLRRAPVFCVWRALVEARDSQIRWEVGGGVSFPLAKILAAHITDILIANRQERPIVATVSIPDDLDEYGQEGLLKELHKEFDNRGVNGEVRLLWRPVAAALAWLEQAGGDMKMKKVEGNPNDFILVLYLGADAIECVTFRMRVRQDQKGLYYIVPRRERPQNISPLAGYDWVGKVLEQIPEAAAYGGAFWQAFMSFPEVWEMLAGRNSCLEYLPRIWGLESGYDLWTPKPNTLSEMINGANCGPSALVRDILRSSCTLSGSLLHECSWPERLTRLVRETVNTHSSGQMVGMVVCGPLAPIGPPLWLSKVFPDLEARGLDTSEPWDLREANRLWLSPGNGAIAQGAALFQERLKRAQPTYRDTLPQYLLLVREGGRYAPFPLVDAQDVEGGDEYEKNVKRRFGIGENSHKLDIVIARHGRSEQLLKAASVVESLDRETGKAAKGLSVAEASLVRHLVRTARNQETALKRVGWSLRNFRESDAAVRYGSLYGALWYRAEGSQISLPVTDFNALGARQAGDTPFRLLSFPFPVPATDEMPVDLHVRIRPASGMAHLEVKPENASFLYGRPVFVDYRSMRPCQPEELDAKGWPPLEEFAPHPDVSIWNNIDTLVTGFEKAIPRTEKFNGLLDSMYDFLKARRTYFLPAGWFQASLPVLSQDGLAGCPKGQELVLRFSRALENGTANLEKWKVKEINRLITRATWLYGFTPEHVIRKIRKDLQRQPKTRLLEAGSRALKETPDLSSILDCIAERVEGDGRFVIQSIRASKNILTFRSNGQDALKERTARILLDAVLIELDEFADRNYYKSKFFVSLTLLLYLLRYRKCNERFLSPDTEETNSIKGSLASYLPGMKRTMPDRRYVKAEEIVNGIIDYLDFSGTTSFLVTLTEFSDSGADNEENLVDS